MGDEDQRYLFRHQMRRVGLEALDINRSRVLGAGDPVDKVLNSILDTFYAYEREAIKARTTNGREARARDGLYWGGRRPFGFRLRPR